MAFLKKAYKNTVGATDTALKKASGGTVGVRDIILPGSTVAGKALSRAGVSFGGAAGKSTQNNRTEAGTPGDPTGATAPADNIIDAAVAKNVAARNASMAEGRKRGLELFGSGALGRETQENAGMSSDILARRKSALAGLDAKENQALRERGVGDVNRGLQTNLRALRSSQGNSGVRGAAAQAGALAAAKQAQDAKQNLARELILENVNQKRSALGDYEGSVGRDAAVKQAIQRANLERVNKEKLGQVSTELGYGSLGATDRSNALGNYWQQAYLNSANNQAANAGRLPDEDPNQMGGVMGNLFRNIGLKV